MIKRVCMGLFAAVSFAVAQEGQLIVNTQFDKLENGALAVTAAPADFAALPLLTPTEIAVTPPSTITPGTETIVDLKPPYAKIVFAADDKSPELETPASFYIDWNLKGIPLEPGRYLVSIDFTILDLSQDGGNFLVTLCDTEGQSLQGHPTASKPHLSIANGKLSGGAQTQIASTGVPYHAEILIDTQQNTRSITVNGDPLVPEESFGQDILDQVTNGCRIERVTYVATGGMDSSRPGATVALSKVEVRKLP